MSCDMLTPRTDKEDGAASEWHGSTRVVPTGFARHLERDLYAATERIAALERERDALKREAEIERGIKRNAIEANIHARAEVERLRALLGECADIVRWADAVAPSGLSERVQAALGEE